jgi:hypothetical protein
MVGLGVGVRMVQQRIKIEKVLELEEQKKNDTKSRSEWKPVAACNARVATKAALYYVWE